MNKLKKLGTALLFILFSFAVSPAFGDMMNGKKTGMLKGVEGHKAAGKVTVKKDLEDQLTLTLTDIRVDKVPDGRVYLAIGGDYTKGVELGKLKQFKGDVTFNIPPEIDPDDYDSVVIWCKKFDVGIGLAYFKNGMENGMMKDNKK